MHLRKLCFGKAKTKRNILLPMQGGWFYLYSFITHCENKNVKCILIRYKFFVGRILLLLHLLIEVKLINHLQVIQIMLILAICIVIVILRLINHVYDKNHIQNILLRQSSCHISICNGRHNKNANKFFLFYVMKGKIDETESKR